MGLLPTETPVCERVKADHKKCTAKAYEDYKTVFAQGEDGRPHWVARKTCNYLTDAIDVCGNGLLEGGYMDEDTTTTSSVGARFGSADRGDEGSGAGGEGLEEAEDSIDQGPWGLAAYAYYWWSGATGQNDRFTRSWSAFMNVWNNY